MEKLGTVFSISQLCLKFIISYPPLVLLLIFVLKYYLTVCVCVCGCYCYGFYDSHRNVNALPYAPTTACHVSTLVVRLGLTLLASQFTL